jgi:hypothetical protein
MSVIAPTPPTAAPTAPDRSNRALFSGQMYTMFLYIKNNLVSEMYALASNAWNNAVEAFNSATAAAASSVSAASSSATAVAAAGATLWANTGATYTIGQAVIAPANLLVYRRKTASSAGTTDPSVDTTNWMLATASLPWKTVSGNYTAVAGEWLRIDTSGGVANITLPASPLDSDTIRWKDAKGTFGTNKVTFLRNGKNLMGAAVDIEITTSDVNGEWGFMSATNDWRF